MSTQSQSRGIARKINDADKTTARPAVCNFNGDLYVFWQSENEQDAIYMSKSNPGAESWPNGHLVVSENATSAPAVTVFNSKIYLFWTGKSHAFPSVFSAWYQTSDDGVSWSDPVEVSVFANAVASQPPAVCTWNHSGVSWLVLGGVDTSDRAGILFSQDGNFPVSPVVSGSTKVAPCLTVWSDELYQFTVNPDLPNKISYVTWTEPNGASSPSNLINNTDSTVASVASIPWSVHRILVTWRAHDGSGSIFETVGSSFPLPNGNSVSNGHGSLAASDHSPALCNLTDTNTYLFYKGKEDNCIYFINHFDQG